MIGGGREQHVGHLAVVGAAAHRRDDAALGPIRVAHLDEPPEPALERREVGLQPGERLQLEPRRLAGRVGRDVRQPMEESAGMVVRAEMGQEIPHAGEHGQARSPPIPTVSSTELQAHAEWLARRLAVRPIQLADDGLGDHE